MRNITVAAIQMQCSTVVEENLKKAEEMIRKAAGKGAQVILLPELFEREYFCQQKRYDFYEYALPVDENPAVQMGKRLARELDVVLPISFYERDGNVLYNSLAWIDADGELLGVYRKTHIPLALKGAEIIFYPTAIGSEPILDTDSMPHWRRCMQGHAGANLVPVVAANRIGREDVETCEANAGQKSALVFYGSSFIADETGELVQSASRDKEEILVQTFDLDQVRENRLSWGIFRDRRPEMYEDIVF